MKQFVVIGGFVQSDTDGDEHYIGPYQLAKMYQVDPQQCLLCTDPDDLKLRGLRLQHNQRILRPRAKGDYAAYLQKIEEGEI